VKTVDFICVICGEKFKKKSDDDNENTEVECPVCGAKNPEKIVYAADRSVESCIKRSYG
jgi:DNA-directed RNA polymerase subunit RPC12/RpoP